MRKKQSEKYRLSQQRFLENCVESAHIEKEGKFVFSKYLIKSLYQQYML